MFLSQRFQSAFVVSILAVAFVFNPYAFAQSDGVPWLAIDELGRQVASPEETPDVRPQKTIGIFYFLWLDATSEDIPTDPNTPSNMPRPYDLTKILALDPNAVRDQKESLLGREGQMHFWGEPLYGYYDSRDPWVVRRHVHMLADAGIDVLIFDATNAVTYPWAYLPLCDLLLETKDAGFEVPQVTFSTNTDVGATTRALWNEFYTQEKYAPLFFRWEGKPLLLSNPKEVPEDLRDRFTLRATYWPDFGMHDSHDSWRWEDAYPQPFSWTKDEQTPEEASVSPAHNLTRDEEAVSVDMSWGTGRGRSFVVGEECDEFVPNEGRNFTQQWSRVRELDPPFVWITGWNEWIAGRWFERGEYSFVDQFDREFSRDLEPVRGLWFDNYYLQTIDEIRKFKGTPRLPAPAPRRTMNVETTNGSRAILDQWADVKPTLRDYLNETAPRDFVGCGGTSYKSDSGRNDLTIAKVARDDENVYFYIETKEPIVPELPNGLCLAIDVDCNLKTGWRGADLLIGREYHADGTVSAEYGPRRAAKIETNFNGVAGLDQPTTGAWETTSEVDGVRWTLDRDRLQLTVPLVLLKAGGKNDEVSFKWLDNVPFESAIDLYEKGDVAPEGAFFYRVAFEK